MVTRFGSRVPFKYLLWILRILLRHGCCLVHAIVHFGKYVLHTSFVSIYLPYLLLNTVSLTIIYIYYFIIKVYIAHTGTAIAALSMCYDNTKPSNTERRALYQDALLKYDQWVRFGSKETPKCYFKKNCKYDGNKSEVANTFINQSTGALSDGYYKNAINLMPYTIATATYGGVGYAEMMH